MSIYLPPIARKKKVERAVRDSKSKLFSLSENDLASSQSLYQQDFLKFNTLPAALRVTSPGRRNKPQPTAVAFNWKNTRSLGEPICFVATESVKNKQARWWPDEAPKDKKPKPNYSLLSTSRFDYKPINTKDYIKSCEEEMKHFIETKRAQATGRERISYEHQYNSRLPNNQPERGKLHGSFINDEIYS